MKEKDLSSETWKVIKNVKNKKSRKKFFCEPLPMQPMLAGLFPLYKGENFCYNKNAANFRCCCNGMGFSALLQCKQRFGGNHIG